MFHIYFLIIYRSSFTKCLKSVLVTVPIVATMICVYCVIADSKRILTVYTGMWKARHKYIAAVDVKAGVLRQASDMNLLRCVECTILLLT